MDTVKVRGIKAEGIVGVHDWERKVPRTLVVDVELPADVARAAKSDALKDALDYAAVAKAVGAFVGASNFQLIETLAEKLAEKLRAEFGAAWVRLEVHKPGAVPSAQDVSVAIERGKKP
jgi:dihydroneopterin aldolase